MLTAAQFQQWCLRLQVEPKANEVLTRVHSSPPARRVGSRANNVSGAYASRKMGCAIQFESHTVELWAISTMEHDPEVLEYYDQPTTLELHYQAKSGRAITVSHTPDFLVLMQDSVRLEEVSMQFLLFGTLYVVLGLCSLSLYGLLAGTIATLLKGSARFQRIQRYVTESIYIAVGVTAAFAGSENK